VTDCQHANVADRGRGIANFPRRAAAAAIAVAVLATGHDQRAGIVGGGDDTDPRTAAANLGDQGAVMIIRLLS
jgi:hypothetical protein